MVRSSVVALVLVAALLSCSPLLAANFCTGCGARLTEGARFCQGCGKPVDDVAPPQAPVYAPPPATVYSPPPAGVYAPPPAAVYAPVLAPPLQVPQKREDQLARAFLRSQLKGHHATLVVASTAYVNHVEHFRDYEVTRKVVEVPGAKFHYIVKVLARDSKGHKTVTDYLLRIQTQPDDRILRFSAAADLFYKTPAGVDEPIRSHDFD